MRAAARERQDVAEEPVEDRVEGLAGCRRVAREALHELFRPRAAERRRRLVAQPVDERVDRAVAERAHLLRVELERIMTVLDGP